MKGGQLIIFSVEELIVKTDTMKITREFAMRFWTKQYGKELKVTDFAGRIIVKSAYDDRSSKYGWNLDHILPQSKGGVTAEHNLVCCHILTNDEKANKFPTFKANDMLYQIIKVENHYEIRPLKDILKVDVKPKEEEYNLYDSASGIRLYKSFKGCQTKKRFVGTIEIILEGIIGADTALTDFVEEVFIEEDVQFANGANNRYNSGTSVRILIKNYEMPNNSDINDLLDKCILLNTYLDSYFKPLNIVEDYSISFRVDCYKDRKEFYSNDVNVAFIERERMTQNNVGLRINSLVIQNSYAKDKFDDSIGWDKDMFYNYGYIFTKLAKNLEKEVSKQK